MSIVDQEYDEIMNFPWNDMEEKMSQSNKWISVKERKPDTNKEVLGFVDYPDGIRTINVVMYDNRDDTWTDASDLIEDLPVTHWMPLPDFPE